MTRASWPSLGRTSAVSRRCCRSWAANRSFIVRSLLPSDRLPVIGIDGRSQGLGGPVERDFAPRRMPSPAPHRRAAGRGSRADPATPARQKAEPGRVELVVESSSRAAEVAGSWPASAGLGGVTRRFVDRLWSTPTRSRPAACLELSLSQPGRRSPRLDEGPGQRPGHPVLVAQDVRATAVSSPTRPPRQLCEGASVAVWRPVTRSCIAITYLAAATSRATNDVAGVAREGSIFCAGRAVRVASTGVQT